MSEELNTPKELKGDDKTETVDAVKADVVKKAEPEIAEPKRETAAPVVRASVVTPNAAADPVHLSKCVFKNPFARKSLTIHHLQRRLHELGFKDAYSDKDGWYGDLTAASVEEFQKVNGLPVTGLVDADTFLAVFDGDRSVTVVLDA